MLNFKGGISLRSIWKGEKVKLRPIEINDIEGYFNVEEELDTDLQRMGDIIRFPMSKDKMKERIEKMANRTPENDEYQWIIEDSKGNAVGDINTYLCNSRNGTFSYGIALKKEYWGKGYALDAIKIVLRFYFRELRYQKVTIFVYSFNNNSIRFHKKFGFKEEGRIRNMIYTNGEYYDNIYFGLTKKELNMIDKKNEL